MLSPQTLRAVAATRLNDARVLFAGACHDGAAYLCGYAVELALKARICDTLNWAGYPETRKEFEDLSNFKTHKLGILLQLSGRDTFIRKSVLADWSNLEDNRTPEMRYRPVGSVLPEDARQLINSTETLLLSP